MPEARHAILIGCGSFPEDSRLQTLRCPENDVDGIAEVLTSAAHGLFQETAIHVLKNRPHGEILLALNKILQSARKDDFILIYYSGHGKPDQAGRLHLATADTTLDALGATSLPMENVKSFIDICASNKIVIILDCCFSGAAGELFLKGDVNQQLNTVSQARGIYILTASTALQVAQEKEGERYGVLTKHIIEGVKEHGADADGDGLVTMDELYSYVHRRVMEESPQQPEKFAFNVRGDLVFAKTGILGREERKDRIRKALLELADRNLIPDSMLTRSIEVLRTPVRELSLESRRYDELLDGLYCKRLEIGQFIEEWYRVAAVSSIKPADVAARPAVAAFAAAADSAAPETAPRQLPAEYALKRTLPKHPKGALAAAFSPGGGFLAVGAGDGLIRIWETATGKLATQLEAGSGPIWALRFDQRGAAVYAAGPGNRMRLWNVSTSEAEWTSPTQPKAILSFDVLDTRGSVAAAGYAGNVLVWEKSGKELLKIPCDARAVHSVRFSPDGKLLAFGDSEKRVTLCDAESGRVVKTLRGHAHSVICMAFRPDGSQLASAGRDGQIRLWDTSAWVCRRAMKGHENSILSLAYHPSGRIVASASADSTIRFWDSESGEPLRVAESGHLSVNFAIFHPDGTWLASGGADETVRLWQLTRSRTR
jgi:WD40 repeat protein